MKILLLSAPYVKEYMRNARCDFVSLSATQWYPVLLGYCGAYLEGQGHNIKFIDAPSNGMSHEETEKIIVDYKPDLLVLYTGKMSENNDLEYADKLIGILKCDSVIVGPFASINPVRTLSNSKHITKLVSGEFEHPVGEIAEGKKSSDILNLIYKENGQILKNTMRPYLTGDQLDAIPFISKFFKEHIDIYRYKTPSEYYPFIDIMTGRGCKWGLCTYCLWVHTFIKGRTYNVRSAANVVAEFKYIEKEMPEIRSIMLQDDTFTEERAREFCELKLKEGVKQPWSCYARADMDLDVLKLMKRSGCRNLHVGYESGDQAVLNKIKKGLTVEQMTKFTENAKMAGLRIHGDFAMGFPEETCESANKTIEWAYKLNPHTAQFQLMIPFEGTPFYADMKSRGWLNSAGQPDMPQYSNEQIRAMAKKAYRRFYLSPKHIWKCMCNPYEFVFSRFKTIMRAIPAMFWKKWTV